MYEDQSEPNRTVVKDMGDDYNTKVSIILSEIDSLKQMLQFGQTMPGTNIPLVIVINDRLHSLFIKLSAKATIKEIEQQKNYNRMIRHYAIRSFHPKKYRREDGSIVKTFKVHSGYYQKVIDIIERREMHINKIMERVGLTAKEETKRKRLI